MIITDLYPGVLPHEHLVNIFQQDRDHAQSKQRFVHVRVDNPNYLDQAELIYLSVQLPFPIHSSRLSIEHIYNGHQDLGLPEYPVDTHSTPLSRYHNKKGLHMILQV